MKITTLIIGTAFISGLITPLYTNAAWSYPNSYNRSYWQNTNEGEIDEEEEERATSRSRMSSGTQKKIDKLDNDEVDDMPIPILFGVTQSQLSENFGDPRDGGDRTHEGLDIMAPLGAYIVSPTDAVVTSIGDGSSAGLYVYTANPGEERFAYMHLDEIADGVKEGTELKKGDLIGYVGNTGNASGGATHLHFEIRDEDRDPSDPYPRLTEEFSLEEQMDAVADIIDKSDDEEEVAEALVTAHKGIFVAAVAQKINLPEEIEDALEKVVGTIKIVETASSTFTRNLTLASQGQDVVALQSYLIAEDAGPKAKALAAATATGYFGALTQAALAEYQAREGIIPAVGYFGAITKAHILAQ